MQDEEPSDLHKAGSAVPGVYALGDCCADLDHPLPALAQVGGLFSWFPGSFWEGEQKSLLC